MNKNFRLQSKNGTISIYHFPAPTPQRGTLVCIHGGPGGDHHGNDGIFDEVVESCRPLGYDIVQFDMFGAGDSDGRPEDITLQSQLHDYQAVLQYSRAELPQPIHVVGESMGATVAAMDWQEDIASYVLLWPAFDLVDTDLEPYFDDPWLSVLKEQGFLEDNGLIVGKTFIDEILSYDFSQCFNLPPTPCLLVHGKGDTAVPFQQALKAVAKASGPCVLFAHPTGDHGLQEDDERAFTKKAYTWWLSK